VRASGVARWQDFLRRTVISRSDPHNIRTDFTISSASCPSFMLIATPGSGSASFKAVTARAGLFWSAIRRGFLQMFAHPSSASGQPDSKCPGDKIARPSQLVWRALVAVGQR